MKLIFKTNCIMVLIFEIVIVLAVDQRFSTCDLDLSDEAQQYLDEKCHNLNQETRQLMLQETESFKQFHQKLTEYESSVGEEEKDWDFREKLYDEAELFLCQNNTEIQQEFVDCLVEKRNLMIKLIDEKLAEK